ncbi:hypothetical protein H4R26_004074 [Coemansia thaxteri]|uniref:Uncharacterized protein n=1 Tax=Coemansia thaxteri TaxID=2663907 RepID=A0A9W8EE02_9FUNG|nr:hypothetical protein H4R26_004074 [Coemansia thaxteri]
MSEQKDTDAQAKGNNSRNSGVGVYKGGVQLSTDHDVLGSSNTAKTLLGISTTAAKALLELVDTDRVRIVVPFHFDLRSPSLLVLLGTTVAVVLLLVANGAYILVKGLPRQDRGIASIVEGSLILLSTLVTLWVLTREARLETHELDRRLHAVACEIREWTGTYADLRTPQLPTITTYMALRDGTWRDVPTLLLVKYDIIALGYGEAAPCQSALYSGKFADSLLGEHVLARGQALTPDTMRTWGLSCELTEQGSRPGNPEMQPWNPQAAGYPEMAGRVLFLALDTPLGNHLDQIAIHHQRTARSVLQNQILAVVRLCVLRILPAIAAAALIANLTIYAVVDISQRPQKRMAVEAIAGKTAYILFPFACTAIWPVYWILVRVFSNACEVVLFDTLQRSKTEYEDMEDIDEFDVEALPPTKDITVGICAILERMCWLLTNCDYRNLSRSSNLSETLGNITVICSIDKEGTIAEPFCTPEQIVVPDPDEDYAILDLAEQQIGPDVKTFIIDDGWERHLPSLRPLGLNCSLNTSAHGTGKLRMDATHRRHNCMRQHGKILSSQDTCLCKIGRAIGFTSDDLARFHLLKEIDVFAPFHRATELLLKKDICCAASLTSAIFQTEEGPGKLQMLTDGNVELVLGMCLDYFDGLEVRPLSDRTMAMHYGLYLNALQQDLQCLAFAYRPLAVDPRGLTWPGWGSKSQIGLSPMVSKASVGPRAALTKRGAYVDIVLENDDELPLKLSSQKHETSNQLSLAAQSPLESTGCFMASEPKWSDNVDAASSKIVGSQELATIEDYSAPSDPGPVTDLPKHFSEAARQAHLQAKSKFSRSSVMDQESKLDYTLESLQLFPTEQSFLRDAVTEQIFLGLVTFAYDPKVDVCDFIEDLSLAGIRFVYFSKAKGRQSKSFAERLGLETDWNTCILLSSVPDGPHDDDDDGYVEDHDIKAQLPRGIESIRSHLKEVDDIPLQISLFAECTPESAREMIAIFQENGDIACCIGSALKDSNTLTFAVADLAVGIEPIPHFNRVAYGGSQGPFSAGCAAAAEASDSLAGPGATRSAALSGHDVANDGSISTSGALVTQYALGAALTCIPCPLFLQHDTSLYTLMQVISEARRLMGCIQQSALLLVAACLALAVVNFVSAMCLLPPALNGFMLLWVLWIVVPLLGATMLFVPHDENIMSTMPLKNQNHVSDMPRFSAYMAIRMLPPVVLTVLVYVTALERMMMDVPHLGQLSAVLGKADWLALDHGQQWALLAAQTYAMVAFVFHCICISSTLMYRTRSWLEFVPFRNIAWVVGSALCLTLTLVFAALLLAFGEAHVGRVAWYTYFIAFAGPLMLLPLQEACKLHDKKRWVRLQKLAKLEFKTKLGQHSPL